MMGDCLLLRSNGSFVSSNLERVANLQIGDIHYCTSILQNR